MANLNDLIDKPHDYYTGYRSEMLEFLPPSVVKILDVGCGEGYFGLLLKKRGLEVWGVEVDRKTALIAEKNLDRVIVGDICKVIEDLPDSYFDCIVFNDVLEHLVDPFTLLFKIKGKLSIQGIVVASIPNVRYFDNLKNLLIKKQWKYEDCGILDKTHIRFFTENSMRETFNSLGYEVLRIQGIRALNPSWKFKLLNLIFLGHLSDTKYERFVCVIKPFQ